MFYNLRAVIKDRKSAQDIKEDADFSAGGKETQVETMRTGDEKKKTPEQKER